LQLVRNVDEALARNPALTKEQSEDVRRLRADLQDLCRAGKMDEARRCEELALTIIREGAPAPE
jgi:hypothetical protein